MKAITSVDLIAEMASAQGRIVFVAVNIVLEDMLVLCIDFLTIQRYFTT